MNSPLFNKIDGDGENEELGDSILYVGIRFLRLVSNQMESITEAEKVAHRDKGEGCMLWLHELRIFYDLIENRTGLAFSDKTVKLFKYVSIDNKLIKEEVEVSEKEKYETYFSEIENMIERNQMVSPSNGSILLKYKNDKEILFELSRCTRELLRDANQNHLIMPEGMKNLKDLAKGEWIDRDKIKEF